MYEYQLEQRPNHCAQPLKIGKPKADAAKVAGKYDEEHFKKMPYCEGFDVSPADVTLFKKLTEAGSVPETPHFQRWYQHMAKQMEKNAI